MKSIPVSQSTYERLPQELQVALRAVETEEVQNIIRALAKYNLGVFMPHSHKKGDGKTGNGFEPLPPDMMSVEDDLITSFIPRHEMVASGHGVPTGWRWIDSEAVVCVASGCFYNCND